MRGKLLVLGTIVLASLAVAALAGVVGADAAAEKGLKIAYIGPKANTYSEATYKGLVANAKKNGNDVTYVDGTFDPAKEFAALQTVIASKQYDAIVVIPIDSPGLVPAARQAIKAGITLVSTNFALGSNYKTRLPQVAGQAGVVIAPTFYRGQLLGRSLVQACKGVNPCEVGWIAAFAGLPWDETLLKGAKSIIAKHKSIEIASYQGGGNFLASGGLKVAQDMLQAHPDLDVILTTSDQMTSGAELAVKKAGKTGKVKLIGHGAGCVGTKALKSGRWFAAVPTLPYSEGFFAGQIVENVSKGGKKGVGIDPIQRSGSPTILTKKNAGKFKCEWQG